MEEEQGAVEIGEEEGVGAGLKGGERAADGAEVGIIAVVKVVGAYSVFYLL